MATPTLTHHQLSGALGEVLVDVRSGDRHSARPAVLVLPGFKGFKDFGPFPALSERLARAGFTAVTLSVSGAGVDEAGDFTRLDRFARNTISAELADLARVLTALDSGVLGVPKPTSVGIIGHSRGGGVAILLADQTPRIAALATWAAVSSMERWTAGEAEQWRKTGSTEVVNSRTGQRLPLHTDLLHDVVANRHRFDVVAAAQRLSIPWLLAHGTADETVPFPEGELLARGAGERASALWLEGAMHAFGGVHPFAGMTPHLSQLFDATVGHFSRHLG